MRSGFCFDRACALSCWCLTALRSFVSMEKCLERSWCLLLRTHARACLAAVVHNQGSVLLLCLAVFLQCANCRMTPGHTHGCRLVERGWPRNAASAQVARYVATCTFAALQDAFSGAVTIRSWFTASARKLALEGIPVRCAAASQRAADLRTGLLPTA